ncbi:hypothetical protein [Streptomyces sp. NPDC086777]
MAERTRHNDCPLGSWLLRQRHASLTGAPTPPGSPR